MAARKNSGSARLSRESARNIAARTAARTVDDSGPGIPEERREEVFEPFVRLEGSRSRETGGVGLSIARSIARAHGGNLTLGESKDGGLRATIALP